LKLRRHDERTQQLDGRTDGQTAVCVCWRTGDRFRRRSRVGKASLQDAPRSNEQHRATSIRPSARPFIHSFIRSSSALCCHGDKQSLAHCMAQQQPRHRRASGTLCRPWCSVPYACFIAVSLSPANLRPSTDPHFKLASPGLRNDNFIPRIHLSASR